MSDNSYKILARTEVPEKLLGAPTEGVARKYDTSKVRLELLSVPAITAIGEVLTYGANKYKTDTETGDHNWRRGFVWSRLIGATLRHVFAHMAGEDRDPESGLLHIAHAGCCIMFLLEFSIVGKGSDDRYKTALMVSE